MTSIQKAAARLIKKHGSLRKAQAASGIHYSLLQKLAKGSKANPTVDTLAKLGLEVRVTHVRKANGS